MTTLNALTAAAVQAPAPAAAPAIDDCTVALGDVLSGPKTGLFSNGRVKGWSPCGQWVYVAWLGCVPLHQAQWCDDIEASHFARLYRPVTENRWDSEALGWGIAPPEALIPIRTDTHGRDVSHLPGLWDESDTLT
jgi:hypothetical protein